LFAFTEAGTQVSAVTMSHQSLRVPTLPCLLLFIKGLIKESLGDFGGFFAFGFFTLGFLVWEAFGREKNY
jgi:hypothetical protein